MSASAKIRKHLGLIEYMLKIGATEREKQLLEMKNSTLKFLVNLILNIIYKKVDISDKSRDELRPHKSDLVKFISKSESLKTRRDILMKDDTFKLWFSAIIPDLRKTAL